MYEPLGTVRLKSGELMEVGVIQAPDEAFSGQIEPFLQHKRHPWIWHVERCMQEPLDQLETRFYVGRVDGTIIANVMTVEYQGVGILGHVFTHPDHRRKGACRGVMGYQMEHFRKRGGRALYLGTGYNSHPYHIYASFGFQSVIPRSGFMRYWTEPDFEGHYFAPGETHVKPVEWHDWGRLTALTGLVGYDVLRHVDLGIFGPSNFEGAFLQLKHALETGNRYRCAKVLVSSQESVVGLLTLVPDDRWGGATYLLDIFVHPAFWPQAHQLLDAVDWPVNKVQCYVDAVSIGKLNALLDYGFTREATLCRQISDGTTSLDVHVLQYEIRTRCPHGREPTRAG